MDEAGLVAALDAHDELVRRCASGELNFWDFEKQYDNFYPRYPLDGHESGPDEAALLARHGARIAVHRELWENVLTKVLSNELQDWAGRAEAGDLIGVGEALRRVRELAARHLR